MRPPWRLHDVARDREAEARAAAPDARAVRLVEALEDARPVRPGDADAVVLDRRPPPCRRSRATATRTSPPSGLNLTALWTRLTNTWPRRASSPRTCGRSGSTSTHERDAPGARRTAAGAPTDDVGERAEVDVVLEAQLGLPPSIRARSSSSLTICDEVAGLHLDLGDPLLIRAGTSARLGVTGERLGEEAHRRERRPQLVAEVVDELGPDLLQAPQLRDVLEDDTKSAGGVAVRADDHEPRRSPCPTRASAASSRRLERRPARPRAGRRGRSPSG